MGSGQPPLQRHPARRDLGILLRQAKERDYGQGRAGTRGRHLDLGSDDAETKLVPSWLVGAPDRESRLCLRCGPQGQASEPGAAYQRRAPALSWRPFQRPSGPDRLCGAYQGLCDDHRRACSGATLQPDGDTSEQALTCSTASPTRSTSADTCRAPEPHDAHVNASVHAPDQCVLKKAQNHLHRRNPLHALQFRAHPSSLRDHPGDGGGRHGSALGCCGYRANRGTVGRGRNYVRHEQVDKAQPANDPWNPNGQNTRPQRLTSKSGH